MKKSILFVVTEDWYFVLHRLPIAQAARDAGFRVLIATQLDKHHELLCREGFEVIPMDWKRDSRNPLQAIKEIMQIIRIYRNVKPDLVHLIALKPSLYGSIAAKITNTSPLVINLAGLGQAFSGDGLISGLVKNVLTIAFRLFFKNDRYRIIVENTDDKDYFVSSVGLSGNSVDLILGIGVNEHIFTYSEEYPNEIPVITMVSRLLWPKGVRELVEAGKSLRQRGIPVIIQLVGMPDKASSLAVPEEQLLAWQQERAIQWLGYREDIPDIWRKSTIAVLPSYYREGIPRSLLEAASSGRPIVTTDMPGCREIVEQDSNGLLVPPRDVVALANALEKLVDDPGLRERMGKAGRDLVVGEFTERKVVRQTMEIYKELA